MFGRRPDGRRLKKQDPIVQMTPYLMPMRCDAQVFLEHKADFEKLSRYIVDKAREGQKITFMQILVAAYVRAISKNPEVNRFIFNKQYYIRNNCSVSYTVLKDPQDHNSNETTVRILFDLTDTVYDVRDRMNAAVEQSRATEDGDFVIRLASALLSIPGLATLIVTLVRLLDKYGIAPRVLIRELPFYSGMFITNNGSIGLHHPLHHIYNFGDVSLFIGMGSVLKEAYVEPDGRARMRRWLPLGITADERVCSGAHYAAFFAEVIRLLDNPEELETPPEQVRFEQGVEYHVPKIAEQKRDLNRERKPTGQEKETYLDSPVYPDQYRRYCRHRGQRVFGDPGRQLSVRLYQTCAVLPGLHRALPGGAALRGNAEIPADDEIPRGTGFPPPRL